MSLAARVRICRRVKRLRGGAVRECHARPSDRGGSVRLLADYVPCARAAGSRKSIRVSSLARAARNLSAWPGL